MTAGSVTGDDRTVGNICQIKCCNRSVMTIRIGLAIGRGGYVHFEEF